MQYLVEIMETLQRTVTVDADNENDAISLAKKEYDNCNIVLDASDITGADFNIIDPPFSDISILSS